MRIGPRPLSPWSAAGLYAFALLLFCWPYADLVGNALPLNPGDVQWRYGFAGLMAAYHHTPILGFVLASGVALWLGHRRTLRGLSVLGVLMALGIVAVALVFSLDMLQVRASRPPETQGSVLAGGVFAILKHATAAVVMVLLGAGGWSMSRKAAGKDDDPSDRIVMKPKGTGS
jgi:hypothetical protein